MSITRAQELRKRRDELHEQNAALLVAVKERWEGRENVKDERRLDFNFDREATAEERAEWDKRDNDSEKLKAEIETLEAGEERMKRHEERGRELAASAGAVSKALEIDPGTVEREANRDPDALSKEEDRELRRFLLGGIANLTPEQRKRHEIRLLRQQAPGVDDPALLAAIIESRAQSVGTGSEGGFLVATGFSGRYEKALKEFGGLMGPESNVEVITTESGNTIEWPTVDDTGNTGTQRAENTEVGETDIVFAQKKLEAYLIDSDLCFVSIQTLQDASIPIAPIVEDLLLERVARKLATEHATGSGSSACNGIVTASTLGKTAASASAFTYVEMIDLKYSVDRAYWGSGAGRWVMNVTSTYKAMKKLLDGDNRPIFQPDVRQGRVDRCDGDPIVLVPELASIAASAKIMLYGNLNKFKIRRVRGPIFKRLEERRAEFHQVGFVALERTDSELINTAAVKHMILAAS